MKIKGSFSLIINLLLKIKSMYQYIWLFSSWLTESRDGQVSCAGKTGLGMLHSKAFVLPGKQDNALEKGIWTTQRCIIQTLAQPLHFKNKSG